MNEIPDIIFRVGLVSKYVESFYNHFPLISGDVAPEVFVPAPRLAATSKKAKRGRKVQELYQLFVWRSPRKEFQ
jgi:hypothetical protein